MVIQLEDFHKFLGKHIIYNGDITTVNQSEMLKLFIASQDNLNKHIINQERKILQDLFLIRDLNVNKLLFGKSEIIQGLHDSLLQKIIYNKSIDPSLFNDIKLLSINHGCILIPIESKTCIAELKGYGDMIGIKWFSD